MKRFCMIAIAFALGAPALALAQPAARSGTVDTTRIEGSLTIAPARSADRIRREVVRRERPDRVARRRAHEPNRRRFFEPNRRRFQDPSRRRFRDPSRRRFHNSARRRAG